MDQTQMDQNEGGASSNALLPCSVGMVWVCCNDTIRGIRLPLTPGTTLRGADAVDTRLIRGTIERNQQKGTI